MLGGKVEEIIIAKTKKRRKSGYGAWGHDTSVCHSATTLLGHMSTVNQIMSPAAADYLLER